MSHPLYIIGTGKVATHLLRALTQHRVEVSGLWGRSIAVAKEKAEEHHVPHVHSLADIPDKAMCIVAVKDDAVEEVCNQLKRCSVAHTSGSIKMTSNAYENGVFYPLQTFSEEVTPDFKSIPFLIESDRDQFTDLLMDLAGKLSDHVRYVKSENRSVIHLAAVFACNFSNHLYSISEDILSKSELPLDILHALIQETTRKMMALGPKESQTGPAIRGDQKVIQKQMDQLEGNDAWKKIYELLTKDIQNGREL